MPYVQQSQEYVLCNLMTVASSSVAFVENMESIRKVKSKDHASVNKGK